jgi:hypothetical protein
MAAAVLQGTFATCFITWHTLHWYLREIYAENNCLPDAIEAPLLLTKEPLTATRRFFSDTSH